MPKINSSSMSLKKKRKEKVEEYWSMNLKKRIQNEKKIVNENVKIVKRIR